MEPRLKYKTKFLQEILLKWFIQNGRTFYWRNSGLSHYEYVIAEILLQRTKSETISKFLPQFLNKFPNWNSIHEAKEIDVQEFLKPIGLHVQRAQRIRLLAKEMTKRKGILPKTREDLESIPFMGQYIANAVELIVFGLPKPLLDVNMARVLERFFGPRKLVDFRYDSYLQNLSKEIVHHVKSKEINWAILDFASAICKSRSPLCNSCPLRVKCTYFKSSHQTLANL